MSEVTQHIIHVQPGEEISIQIVIRATPEMPKNIGEVPSLKEILDRVCLANKVMMEKMVSKAKDNSIVYTRILFYHIAHRLYGYSTPKIGAIVNRHHTSVLAGCKVYDNLKGTDHLQMLTVIHHTQKLFAVKL